MASLFPSGSSFAPFEPLDTVLQRLSLIFYVSPIGAKFRLRSNQLLLVFLDKLDVKSVDSFYNHKLAKYAPQIWVVHKPVDEMEIKWYTCVLIRLTSTNHRFETKSKTFFDYFGYHPFVIPINGQRPKSWNGITEYLNISTQTSSTGPPAFYKINLTKDWQNCANDWLGGHGGQVATSPVLNLHGSKRLDEMTDFYKYMLYNFHRETLVFPMGIPGEDRLIRELKNGTERGWTGRFVIVLMPHESYHYPEAWPRAAQRLQALRDGVLTDSQPPAAILILSVQPITNAGLNLKGVGVVDLDKAADPSKVEDWDDSHDLARVIFPGSVVKPKAQMGHYTLMAHKYFGNPPRMDDKSPLSSSSERKEEYYPVPKEKHYCLPECRFYKAGPLTLNEIRIECYDCSCKRISTTC